jgi:hypothetical protein
MTRPASLIVDGSNLLCRAAFALPKLTLDDDDATPCGGAWGMIQSVLSALESTNADEVHLCWDGGRSPRRLALLPTYKAHRDGDPERQAQMEKVWAQAPMADRVLTSAGAWSYKKTDVEADDVVALVAMSVASRDRDAVIVSNDADFLQLVGGHVSVLRGAGGSAERLWLPGRCPVALVGDNALTTKALIGCKSDGIPGVVTGIGETRAAALREAVLADSLPWNSATLHETIRGRYTPPGYGDAEHKNVTKAVALLRSGDADLTVAALVRNFQLCDLTVAMDWPEVGDAALHPDRCFPVMEGFDNHEEVLLETLWGLGWKPAHFRPLLGLQG